MNGSFSYDLSVMVAHWIRAQPSQCWYNAIRSVLLLRPLFPFGWYVEGWLVTALSDRIDVAEHGWCQMSDFTIVDPTTVLLDKKSCVRVYLPGRTYPRSVVLALPPEPFPPLARHQVEPAYDQAYIRAYEQALMLSDRAGGLPIDIGAYRSTTCQVAQPVLHLCWHDQTERRDL